MAKNINKTSDSDVRTFRLKRVNIEFLAKLGDENNRSATGQLDQILDELRIKKREK